MGFDSCWEGQAESAGDRDRRKMSRWVGRPVFPALAKLCCGWVAKRPKVRGRNVRADVTAGTLGSRLLRKRRCLFPLSNRKTRVAASTGRCTDLHLQLRACSTFSLLSRCVALSRGIQSRDKLISKDLFSTLPPKGSARFFSTLLGVSGWSLLLSAF